MLGVLGVLGRHLDAVHLTGQDFSLLQEPVAVVFQLRLRLLNLAELPEAAVLGGGSDSGYWGYQRVWVVLGTPGPAVVLGVLGARGIPRYKGYQARKGQKQAKKG